MDILADKICKIYKICQSGIDPLLSWHLISSYAMDWICPGLTVDRNWNLVLSLDNRQMQEGEYPEGQEPNLGILGLWRIGKQLLSGQSVTATLEFEDRGQITATTMTTTITMCIHYQTK